MISKENQDFITRCVEENITSCLEEVDFDPTVKEPGHTYGEAVEEVLANKLIEISSDFSLPTKTKNSGRQTRKMEDIRFMEDLINIKLGYEKGKGQPNMVSFNRLSKNFCNGTIDSYWILVIDVTGKTKEELKTKVYFFNLYDHLDYIHYDYGTGQTMLKEKQFFDAYDVNENYSSTKRDIVLKLKEIDEEAFQSHIKLKQKQHEQKQELFSSYI